MFIERLGKEKFEKLVLKFFQQKGAEIKKFDELYIVEHNEYGVIISSKSKLPFIRRIEFNDFYAKYDIAGGFALPTHAKDKSQILRDYLYKKFGEKYLNALKTRLEEDKNKKLEEFKNLIEEENKKSIEELTKE